MQSYTDTNGLRDPTQFSFRTRHSTEIALARIQNDLLCIVDKDGVAMLVLMDLSAAFDTFDHNVLQDRMHSLLGIGGTVIRCFRLYRQGALNKFRLMIHCPL